MPITVVVHKNLSIIYYTNEWVFHMDNSEVSENYSKAWKQTGRETTHEAAMFIYKNRYERAPLTWRGVQTSV